MRFSALVIYLKLLRRAFNVGNAYGWGSQEKKLALKYLRGLEQLNDEGIEGQYANLRTLRIYDN